MLGKLEKLPFIRKFDERIFAISTAIELHKSDVFLKNVEVLNFSKNGLSIDVLLIWELAKTCTCEPSMQMRYYAAMLVQMQ